MYKLRTIALQKSGDQVKGLTCPNEIAVFFENTSFSVERSGTSIIYVSGATNIITKKQIDNYSFKDVRIQ